MRAKFILLTSIFFIWNSLTVAQDLTSLKQINAHKLNPGDQILFDGKVDEGFWFEITPATNFRMQEPREGNEASESTEVRIAFDRDNLYIGVILYDSEPSEIKAYQKRRDVRLVSDERFTWIFDTFNDQRSAYFMEVNPNGLRTDGLLTTGQGGDINLSWDGIWDAKTHIGDFGWSAEIKIPFRSLNFDPESDVWGANFMRVIRRKNETVLWSGHRRNQGIDRPQNAGILAGLSGISQGLGIEVIPYGIVTRLDDQQTEPSETTISPDAGLDINYNITPGLRASLTFNTDFAEAEVDQRQVNLTRFPIQFPEQRNFFLEGANIYEFAPTSQINPFFSRRIGLNEGEQIPITYGARLMGNAGDYNLAFLHVRTGEKDDMNSENFSVARVKRNIGSESTIGVIYTRRATDNQQNVIPNLHDRHTLGSDLELGTSSFLGDQNLQFQSFFVFHNPGFSDDDSTSIMDRSTRGLRLNYPNQPWSAHISYREFGKAYDPALGFTQRNGFRRLNPRIGYAPQLTRSDLIQQIGWDLWFEHLTDMDFTTLTQSIRSTLFETMFTSGDQIELTISRDFERLQLPFDIKRDGSIILPIGTYTNWNWGAHFETASHRRISAELEISNGGFWSGSRTEIGAELTIRPYPGIELEPEYIYTNVRLPEGEFSTNLLRFIGNFDFSTSLFLTSTVQYDDLSKIMGINNRLRWIITPGSDLYLVYNHNWIDEMSRFRTLQNTGTVKLSYTHRF